MQKKYLQQEFKEYLETLGYASSTVYDYSLFVGWFLQHLTQTKTIKTLQDLTTSMVHSYYHYLEHKRGCRTKRMFSSSHLNRQFMAIDKFLEFLHVMGLNAAPSPVKYQVNKTRLKPVVILTKQEVQELYQAITNTYLEYSKLSTREPRQKALGLILDLCYGCGLRKSEALNVKVKDINLDTKLLHVKQGKNYKDRLIPLSSSLYTSLQEFIYEYRRCFNKNKRASYLYPFGNTAISDGLKTLLIASNNQELINKSPSLHSLRHSIATHLLQNGMAIESISKFLGHSSLESTQMYTHISNEF